MPPPEGNGGRVKLWVPTTLAALGLAVALLGFVLLRARPRPAPAGEDEVERERPVTRAGARPRPLRGPVPMIEQGVRRQVGERELEMPQAEQPVARDAGAQVRREPRCAFTLSAACPAFPASREVLLARARCGTLVTDAPAFLFEDAGDWSRPPATTAGDVAAAKIAGDLKAEVLQELDGIYRDLGGSDYRRVSSLSQLRLRAEALANPGAGEVRRMLSEELAGLRPAPGAGDLGRRPPAERYWRLMASLGDRYQTRMAQALGAPAARARREEAGGWPHRRLYRGHCPEDDDEEE